MSYSRDSMETSFCFSCLVALLLCMGLQPTSASGQDTDHDSYKNLAADLSPCFPAVFAFGDSLTDTGNDVILHPVSRPFPFSEAYMPAPRDRTKDGRLVIDFIAQALGLVSPSPYMQAVNPNFKHGVNCGAYGATATAIPFLSPYNLGVQYYWLLRFKANVLRALNTSTAGSSHHLLPEAEYFEKGLYVLEIGANDYIAATMATRLRNQFQLDVGLFVPVVMSRLNDTILSLVATGAKNFLVVNLPPLGCSTAFKDSYIVDPSTNVYLDYDEFECIRSLNVVADLHNDVLRQLLRNLRPAYPNATFIYADYNGVIRQMLTSARAREEQPNSTAAIADGCPSESLAGCYDNIHIISEAANRLTTRKFLSGQFVEPKSAFSHCHFDLELS